MKGALTFIFVLSGIVFTSAQSTIQKKFSKVSDDVKFIITETVFEDGHKEQYITSFPLNYKRTAIQANSVLSKKNIEWDENLSAEGLQKNCATITDIENAFNNALTITEQVQGLKKESLKRIKLDSDFLALENSEQSAILITQLSNTLKDKAMNKCAAKSSITEALESKNSAIFLTNGEEQIAFPHIHAIYNWTFADSYTGWYNRNLLLNSLHQGSKVTSNMIDEKVDQDEFLQNIIVDPTFETATSVVFEMDSTQEQLKDKFKIREISTNQTSDIATVSR